MSNLLHEEFSMKAISFESTGGRSARIGPPPSRRRAWYHGLIEAMPRAFSTLSEWRRRSRDRAELAALDDRALRDIGVSRVDVWREINKPFWRK